MPILYRNRLRDLDATPVTKMTLGELITYEAVLWRWMDKTKGAANIARQLNMIHREVEWRALDGAFKPVDAPNDASHSQRATRPGRVG